MGVLSRVHRDPVGIFGDDSVRQAWGLLPGVLPGGAGMPPTRGTSEYLRAYSQMPWLRAVAGRISTAVARVEWQLYVLKGKGEPRARPAKAVQHIQRADTLHRRHLLLKAAEKDELQQITDHPMLDVLHNANEFQTGYSMRKVTQLHLDLVGDAFWLKERDGQGTVVGVWPIPPNWIMATPTPAFRFFRVSFRAWRGIIPDTEWVWFSDVDPLNPYGRGAGSAMALGDELETDEYAARHTKAFFYNRARPDLLIWPKGQGMTEANTKRLEDDWTSKTQGFWKCHDAATEALTRRGWVNGLDLQEADEVATWNETAQRLEYQRPTASHRYDYDGVMQHWHGGKIDALVTPNHRMWFGTGADNGWRFAESAQLARRGGPFVWREAGLRETPEHGEPVVIPAVHWSGIGRPPHGLDEALTFDPLAFAPLLGYIATEGSAEPARVKLSQFGQNPRKRAVVQAINESLEVFDGSSAAVACDVSLDGVEHEWSILHKGFATWMADHVGRLAAEKRLPAFVFEWPRPAREALADALVKGDGQWSDETRQSGTFWTTSPRLADDVQRLCVELGWRSRALETEAATPFGPCRHWRVSICRTPVRWMQKSNRLRANTGWADDVPYRGVVWCLSVPNGTLFTRRHGSVLLSGNSFKPYFLTREVEVKELDHNFRSQQFVQLREFERSIVMQHFGMPPEILGVLEHSNRSTIDAADFLMARYVMEPRLEFLRSVLQERFAPEYDERLVVEYVNPAVEDRAQQLAAATVAPWSLSVNEWRKLSGQGPLEDEEAGDLHMLPNTGSLGPVELAPEPLPVPAFPVPGAPGMPPPPAAGQPAGANGGGPATPVAEPVPTAPGEGRRALALHGEDLSGRGGWDTLVQAATKAARDAGDADLATGIEKAARERKLPPSSQAAARMEPALARALVRAWTNHASRIDMTALRQAVAPDGVHGDVVTVLDYDGLNAAQTAVLVPALRKALLRGADLAQAGLRQHAGRVRTLKDQDVLDIDLSGTHEAAAAWAREHAAELAKLPADQRQRIKDLVDESISEGVAPDELAQLLRDTVGLTDAQSAAVEHFRERLAEAGTAAEDIAARTERYAAAQRTYRAQTIARTELNRALNAGQQVLWDEAVAQGVIRGEDFEKVWIVTDDDLLEEECEAMADEQVGIDESFSSGDDYPPAHPNCRCAVGLVQAD